MNHIPNRPNDQPPKDKLPTADTGNASNPTPHNDSWDPAQPAPLFGEKAATYLREGGNIEDLPDAEEEQDAEKTIGQVPSKGPGSHE